MSNRRLPILLGLLALGAGCRPRPAPAPLAPSDDQAAEPEPEPEPAAAQPEAPRVEPGELEPGSIRVYGLTLPVGTTERLVTDNARIYYVQAPMARVMRYLQRRLEITNAEIHPLGAMIRGARLKAPSTADAHALDVGVRDEGDRTLVQFWDPQAAPPAIPRSTAESLRAAGVDPATGRPLPGNNN